MKYSDKYRNVVRKMKYDKRELPGPKAQLVASSTADSGVLSFILARSHTFKEIYHEIISTVILLLWLIQEGLLSVTSESMCTKFWLTLYPMCCTITKQKKKFLAQGHNASGEAQTSEPWILNWGLYP